MTIMVRQATLAFERQIEIIDPIVLRPDHAARHLEIKREAVSDPDGQRLVADGNLRRKPRDPGLPVMIAAVGEERDREMRHSARRGRQQSPADISHVGAEFHPDPLLDAAVSDGELPYRDRSVEVEALDREMTFGGDRAAAPAVGEQGYAPFANDQLGIDRKSTRLN